MNLTREQAAAVMLSLNSEELARVNARTREILEGGGDLAAAVRVPLEEIAAARGQGGDA